MTGRWFRSASFLLSSLCLCASVVSSGCSDRQPAAHAQPGNPPSARVAESGPERPVRVKAVRPTREHLKRFTTPQPANVEPFEKIDVYAKASGYLLKLGQSRDGAGGARDLDIGDRVAKGQVLAELWVPEAEQEKRQQEALFEQARSEIGQAEAAEKAAAAMVTAARARVEEADAEVARHDAEVDYGEGEDARYKRMLAERTTSQDQADEKLRRLRVARSARAAAKAAVSTARANLAVEEARLSRARADVEGARARLKVAGANLQQAVILLDYASVRAPFDGVITRRHVDTGAFVQSATMGKAGPLFSLAHVDRLRIVTDVPDSEAAWVRVGQRAALKVDALRGQQFAGKVVRFADALDPATRTMRTEVELDRAAEGLRPGMFGSLTLELVDRPDALLVPAGVLLPAADRPAVLVVEEGRARRQEIAVGYSDGIRLLVTNGLHGDEQVIADGKTAVRDGQAVEVAP